MLVYRVSIWSDRGRIERDVESGRDDALECIYAAGVIATGLKGGTAPVTIENPAAPGEAHPTVWIEKSRSPNDRSMSLIRDAHWHLKEAWLLLSNAGAWEAVSHVREGLRLSRLSQSPSSQH